MKIYTKTGDDGNTSLQGNYRISKSHQRIISYGTIDEANSSLGIVLANSLDKDITEILTEINFSTSAGCAHWKMGYDANTLFSLADKNLYQVKRKNSKT